MTKPATRRAVDASMTLLNEVINHPLDPGYTSGPKHGRPAHWWRLSWVLAVALGLLVGGAVAALRSPLPAAIEGWRTLAARVSLRAEQVAEQTTANRVLADQVAGAEAIALSQADPSAARLASQLVIASGSSAVQGPGWRIQLTQPPEPTAAEQQITAGDLRSIVNGLWYAGAQAVAINQVRLAANAPISMAGESVLVDLVPVMPPYTIEVIGDVADLSKRFANGPASDRISLLKDRFSIRVSFATVSNLVLPAANRVGVFHYAKTLESGDNLP